MKKPVRKTLFLISLFVFGACNSEPDIKRSDVARELKTTAEYLSLLDAKHPKTYDEWVNKIYDLRLEGAGLKAEEDAMMKLRQDFLYLNLKDASAETLQMDNAARLVVFTYLKDNDLSACAETFYDKQTARVDLGKVPDDYDDMQVAVIENYLGDTPFDIRKQYDFFQLKAVEEDVMNMVAREIGGPAESVFDVARDDTRQQRVCQAGIAYHAYAGAHPEGTALMRDFYLRTWRALAKARE